MPGRARRHRRQRGRLGLVAVVDPDGLGPGRGSGGLRVLGHAVVDVVIVGEGDVDIPRPVHGAPGEDVVVARARGTRKYQGVVPGGAEVARDPHPDVIAVDVEGVVDAAFTVRSGVGRGGVRGVRTGTLVADHGARLRDQRPDGVRVGIDRRRRTKGERQTSHRPRPHGELLVPGVRRAVGQQHDVPAVRRVPLTVVERRQVRDRRGEEGVAAVVGDARVEVDQGIFRMKRRGIDVVEAVRVHEAGGLHVSVTAAVQEIDAEKIRGLAAQIGGAPDAQTAAAVGHHVGVAVRVELDARLRIVRVAGAIRVDPGHVEVAAEDLGSRNVGADAVHIGWRRRLSRRRERNDARIAVERHHCVGNDAQGVLMGAELDR